MIERSDLIVIGTPSNISNLDMLPDQNNVPDSDRLKFKFAEIKIEKILKGKVKAENIYYLGSPRWTCDISSAYTGKKAIFFFEDYGVISFLMDFPMASLFWGPLDMMSNIKKNHRK